MIARLLRRLGERRARGASACPLVVPAGGEVWAFPPRANYLEFNLMAAVLPPLPGPNERRHPLVYLEIHEHGETEHLFVGAAQARAMLAQVRRGQAEQTGAPLLAGARFSRTECRAIERVLVAVLRDLREPVR